MTNRQYSVRKSFQIKCIDNRNNTLHNKIHYSGISNNFLCFPFYKIATNRGEAYVTFSSRHKNSLIRFSCSQLLDWTRIVDSDMRPPLKSLPFHSSALHSFIPSTGRYMEESVNFPWESLDEGDASDTFIVKSTNLSAIFKTGRYR